MQVLMHIDKAKTNAIKRIIFVERFVSIVILLFTWHKRKGSEFIMSPFQLLALFSRVFSVCVLVCVCCHFHIFNGLSKLFTLKGINHLMIIMFKHEKMRPQYFYHSFFSLPCYIPVSRLPHIVLTRLSLISHLKSICHLFHPFTWISTQTHNVHTYVYINKMNIFHALTSK